MATVTIKWLEREIERLKIDANEDRRQAEVFQTQANYQESTQPELSYASEKTADQYASEADEIDQQIASYTAQLEDLNRQVGEKEAERERLQQQIDQIDRDIVNMVG